MSETDPVEPVATETGFRIILGLENANPADGALRASSAAGRTRDRKDRDGNGTAVIPVKILATALQKVQNLRYLRPRGASWPCTSCIAWP
jgi:hypothetical protein